MIDYQRIFPFYALPYWKLQLENPTWNPTQNPNSKEFFLRSKISTSYYDLQSPTIGFQTLFNWPLNNGETPNLKLVNSS